MRRVVLAGLVAAVVLAPGAAATTGLSVSPLSLTLKGASSGTIVVRNPGARPLAVVAGSAGFARTLHGGPLVRERPGAGNWLTLRPARFRIAARSQRTLRVTADPPAGAAPGDHSALVLLSTSPPGANRVRVLLRVGVVVTVRVGGPVVHKLEPEALTVRRHGRIRVISLRLANRGNVTERLDRARFRLVLERGGRIVASLGPRPLELLPHSAGIAEFAYRGRLRGLVGARVMRRSYLLRL